MTRSYPMPSSSVIGWAKPDGAGLAEIALLLVGPPPYRRPLLAAGWRTDVVDLVMATVPAVPTAARRALAGNGVVCPGGHGAVARLVT